MGNPQVPDEVINALRAVVGLDGVSVRESDRLYYAGDSWPRLFIRRLMRTLPSERPDAIVWPRDADAVARVLRICSEAGVPVIPYGAGSGVCGGTVPVQGGVILDLKRMNRLLAVDELSMTALVEPGMIGRHLEAALNERGYTLGHFPSSIMCSTVGGWVATRSAGQFSSRYGKIEDMVLGLDLVLPDGTRVALDGTLPHHGMPDLMRLAIGSEGTLGVITGVRLKVHPSPSARRVAGFRFMDLVAAIEAMRNIMQHGLRPAVMRLYDPLDTLINRFSMTSEHPDSPASEPVSTSLLHRFGLEGADAASLLTGPMLRSFLSHPGLIQTLLSQLPLSSLLVVGFEGDGRRTREHMEQTQELVRRATGRDLGPEPGEHWYRHRYSVSFKMSPVFGQGAFVETLEFAGLWKDIPAIYRNVRSAVLGRAAVLAHFSHAYREGCAVYFTVAGYRSNPTRLMDLYDEVIRRAITTAVKNGATVSHHHGIGLMKRDYTPEEYRGGDRVYWAVKTALDPSGMLNPGKVYPPTVPVPADREQRVSEDQTEFESVASWEHRTVGRRVMVPEVPEEVSEILSLARATGRKVVCQQARRPGEEMLRAQVLEERPDIPEDRVTTLDLSRLDQVLDMDPVSGTVTVQAGIAVVQLENFLHEKGFTLGFVPRSRLLLSLGDYLATSSPSEGSPLYGTILENCIGLSAVLADGTPFTVRPSPRRAAGPDLMHVFLGARGRFGIITAACLRVFPLPVVREAIAFAVDDPVLAVSAARTALVRSARPEWVLIVVRAPTRLDSRKRVRIVFQFGGDRGSVTAHLSLVRSVMEGLGMEGEPVRAEERMSPQAVRARSMERFLPMHDVMDLIAEIGRLEGSDCPEVHVTDLSSFGATFRMLLREATHEFPPEIARRLASPDVPDAIAELADRLKRALDPQEVLNPHVRATRRGDLRG